MNQEELNFKHQAAVDNGYSDDTIEFYKDTLRMELRCKRKYINKLTKGMSNAEGLIYFYRNMQNFVEKIFFSAFRDTDVCHVSAYALDKLVKRKMKTKKVKCSNMRNLVTFLNKKSDMDIDTALDLIWNSDRTKVKIISYFRAMDLSPLAIQCKDVPYLQSLESLLEFTLLNENDDKYYRLMRKLSRGKEVLLHEQSY